MRSRVTFAVTLRRGESKLDAEVRGELDALTTPEFCAAVESAIADGMTDILLDCRRLTFVDSTGMGALLDIRKQVMAVSGQLILFGPTEELMRTLALTGLDRVFHIVEAP
jgi:anti-sigma B factor antagonist